MKKLILAATLLATIPTLTFAANNIKHVSRVTCMASGSTFITNNGGLETFGASKITFTLTETNDGKKEIKNFHGFFKSSYEATNYKDLLLDPEETANDLNFDEKELEAKGNPHANKYVAEKYYYLKNIFPKNYHEDINESYFAISKDLTEVNYVFQLDQEGGTAHLKCTNYKLY